MIDIMLPHQLPATNMWLTALSMIVAHGRIVTPRGKPTTELLHHTVLTDMSQPAVWCRERKLNYSFMAAEALWMLDGRDDLEPLVVHTPRMASFSDDGRTLAGAYGPRIMSQHDYVVSCLCNDINTRQAVLTTWNRNPPPSKDIPCTVSMQFMIRNRQLNAHVYMRSSDVWLGLPYDTFSFSMVAAHVACDYNQRMLTDSDRIRLGTMHLTAGSMHLYHSDMNAAQRLLHNTDIAPSNIGNADVLQRLISRGVDGYAQLRRDLALCVDRNDTLVDWSVRPINSTTNDTPGA